MKSRRFAITAALILLSPIVFAQSHDHKATNNAAPTEAQKAFVQLKSLAGTWAGAASANPPQAEMPSTMQVSLRVTSRGNALVHEMSGGKTDNLNDTDHPVTMFYVDGDRLLLTHYCDAGNRPRMVARTSPDGKKVEFDFLDVAGGTQFGHMHHAVFTIIDANHHTEDWTYMTPGDKPVQAHLDLVRISAVNALEKK
jgi:hypothetical protein